jgi:hypothetical protein
MGKNKDSSLNQKQFHTYFTRYAHPIEYLGYQPVSEKLGIVVTVPCFNEPDLISTLESLYNCDPTQTPVEIIVLINQTAKSDKKIIKLNEQCYRDATIWAKKYNTPNRRFHIIFEKGIPEKHAGVGLARKIVMDEAIRRLAMSKVYNGIVIGMDADCKCDLNYLSEIERYFQENPAATGATIYFEHPISLQETTNHSFGIASYELHLRYLVQALRYSQFPYAFHTLGSTMAVRADTYVKQGGMNKRKAGEDFYFLNKVIPLGNFGEINTTRVIPSGRISDRVPFGTGKAMMKWSESGRSDYYTYNPLIFEDLRTIYSGINEMAGAQKGEIENYYDNLSPYLQKFISKREWIKKIDLINRQVTSIPTFRYRFYQWMNGLKTLKYIHFARDEAHTNVPVIEAYSWLKSKIGLSGQKKENVYESLSALRLYDKENPYYFRKTTIGTR